MAKLLYFAAGIGIGILMTIIILRKDIFKVINYHNGLPDIEDIDDLMGLYFFEDPQQPKPGE